MRGARFPYRTLTWKPATKRPAFELEVVMLDLAYVLLGTGVLALAALYAMALRRMERTQER